MSKTKKVSISLDKNEKSLWTFNLQHMLKVLQQGLVPFLVYFLKFVYIFCFKFFKHGWHRQRIGLISPTV